MKRFTLFLMLGIVLPLMAQTPEKVQSIVRMEKSYAWFEQQAQAWKKQLDADGKNGEAWIYFYTANRMAKNLNFEKWEQNQGSCFLPLDKIVEMAKTNIPNTFEVYYLEAYNENMSQIPMGEPAGSALMKAQALRPFDKLLFPHLMNKYQFDRDMKNIDLTCKKWFESNEMLAGLLNTAYNMLMSVDKNGILLVNGDNDTYPAWVLQQAKNIRKDVAILNISLLTATNGYRAKVFGEAGIPELSKPDAEITMKDIVAHIIENAKNRPVYVSAFFSSDVYKKYESSMYLTGLAFRYSKTKFNNLPVLKENFEKKFLKDYLEEEFVNQEPSQSIINNIKGGYFPIFYSLYKDYTAKKETQKVREIKALAQKVSDACGNLEQMKYLEK